MHGENALHAFAVADPAHGEHLVQPMSTPPNHNAGEYLNALFVAFNHFGMHAHGIADAEIHGVLCETVPIQFYQVMPGS